MNEKECKKIELRSEEVQEVMNQIPHAILRYGITVLLMIVMALLAFSAFFSYPDSIDAEFTLSSQTPPTYIMTKSGGRLEELYIVNGQLVKKGCLLGVIENIAETENVLFIRDRLQEWVQNGSRIEMISGLFVHHILELGSIQPYYSSCLLAWNNYLRNVQEDRRYETELNISVASLLNAILEWENSFLLVSPVEGKVAFLQPWKKNQNVEMNENMFVIIPSGTVQPIGKALLPMDGSGKVEIGQSAIIRLSAFPEQEFGFIKGKVTSISPVPDSENRYVLEISLPNGLKTTYGKELPPVKTMTGIATIVTKERSLLKRLLNYKF